MKGLAAVILAAGASSRMGQFKPLLMIDGQTMIGRVADSMQRAGASPVVLVTGYQAEWLKAHLRGRGLSFVHNDRYYETQMMDSLLMGLAALPADTRRVLVALADVPLVKDETIEALLAAPGAFVRPVCGKRGGHPVLIDYALYPHIKAYTGKGGLRGAAADSGVQVVDVPVDDRGVTLDGDTRAGYEKLLKYNREETNRPQPLQLDLQLGLRAETAFWTATTAQFLELIAATGAMLSACQCMHISYTKGWTMINEAERQLGYPLLQRSQGGSGGGGSELTEQGHELLARWQAMQAELQAAGQAAFQKYFGRREEGAE